ncbi:Com family DNA-binding transcriptional regulator [Roseibium sp. MMSF_3361]|uniref:Com family DNA-binding transcriptional regulator n=1 Tax=unclassified Roseibium TaxID=2629323 RepID=UPI003532119A
MQDIRCGSCNALLFKTRQGIISNDIQIKCRRCGTLNHLRPVEPSSERRDADQHERPSRRSTCGSSSQT